MASEKFQPLIDQVTKITTVVASAVALINGIGDRINTAVQDALAGGATADEIAAIVTTQTESLKADADALSTAVAANTPNTPPAPAAAGRASGS